MRSVGFTFWEDDGRWLGYLDDYPDYKTQGTTLEDLQKHLRDFYTNSIRAISLEYDNTSNCESGETSRFKLKKKEPC